MSVDRAECERAVIAAALAWERSRDEGRYPWGTPAAGSELLAAINALRSAPLPREEPPALVEPNQPTGFVVTKPWKIIPAGWFVRAKTSGPWYEVLATRRVGDKQEITFLFDGDGKTRTFLYDPDMEVKCRRGTLAPSSVEHALKVLGEGAEIIQDPAEDGS